jgi:hypothetical protein
VSACKINTDLDQAVAIEIVLPDSGRVELTDTFLPSGRALNGLGDSVAADLRWASLDTAIVVVLDSTTGVSLPKALGLGRLQARAGNLISNPQNVTVLARLDSVLRVGARSDTAVDSLSSSLQVQAYATGGIPTGRRVVYAATIYPDSGRVVTFVPNDSVLTNASGIASTQLRLLPGLIPDSVVVTVTMKRPNGTPIPGSGLTFVVEYGP